MEFLKIFAIITAYSIALGAWSMFLALLVIGQLPTIQRLWGALKKPRKKGMMNDRDQYKLFGYRLIVSPMNEGEKFVHVDPLEKTITVSPAQMTALLEDRAVTVRTMKYKNRYGDVFPLMRLAPKRMQQINTFKSEELSRF